jgi:hypothetical protein
MVFFFSSGTFEGVFPQLRYFWRCFSSAPVLLKVLFLNSGTFEGVLPQLWYFRRCFFSPLRRLKVLFLSSGTLEGVFSHLCDVWRCRSSSPVHLKVCFSPTFKTFNKVLSSPFPIVMTDVVLTSGAAVHLPKQASLAGQLLFLISTDNNLSPNSVDMDTISDAVYQPCCCWYSPYLSSNYSPLLLWSRLLILLLFLTT